MVLDDLEQNQAFVGVVVIGAAPQHEHSVGFLAGLEVFGVC
jgi:hypothetical protein